MGNNKFEDTFITGITPHDSPPMGRGYDPPSTRGFEELSPSEDTGQGLPAREVKGSTGSGLSNNASPRKKSIDMAVLEYSRASRFPCNIDFHVLQMHRLDGCEHVSMIEQFYEPREIRRKMRIAKTHVWLVIK